MIPSVAGSTAIVTGAGSGKWNPGSVHLSRVGSSIIQYLPRLLGINLAFASLLLSKGCNVIFADLSLRPEAADVVSAYSTSSDHKARAIFQQTDVTDWGQLSSLFALATSEFGGANIVCPGAGVYEPPMSSFWLPPESSPLSKDDPSQSRYKTLDINLTHPIRCTQLAIAHFLARPLRTAGVNRVLSRGTVVHISSIAAQVSPLFVPIYNASKAGLSHFVRSLAPLEKQIGIRVNGVAPGLIKTPLWTEHPEKLKMINDDFDDWVSPEEVAEVMLNCVVQEENVGGTILEIGKGQVRRVEVFGDRGPQGAGIDLPKASICDDDVWKLLGTSGWGI
ncbi:MAG: hypothetical protein M1837_006508 [Sclerophora amabilis]|nr:MAG: hypothetical protein M1837_006508 [Sclerophora amabilis]